MKREDLAKLFKLHATILGIGFGATALGLGYKGYKDNCAEREDIGGGACIMEMISGDGEPFSQQP